MDFFEKYTSQDAAIYHSDCLAALHDVSDGSIDLVFADLPYNIVVQSKVGFNYSDDD